MTEIQKREIETLVKSLNNTLMEVEDPVEERIDITGLRVEETTLIRDLLANYIRKKSK